MASFDISKYRSMFLEESVELFENTDTLLLKAEESGHLDDEEMNSLFRYIHTLKGSSASVELSNFAKFTHEVESFMDKLRNKQIPYQADMATLLIDCVDAMKTVLDEEVNGTLTSQSFENLTREYINIIKEISEGLSPNKQEHEAQTSTEPQANRVILISDDAFGFFDDDFIQQSETQNSNDDGFGFFDDEIANTATATKEFGIGQVTEDDGFGFFDDEIINIDQTDSISETSIVNKPTEDHFGFFDHDLQIKHTQLETSSQDTLPAQNISIPDTQITSKTLEEKKEATAENKEVKAANNIRVDLSKIDVLMNNVGELVIVNSMLFQLTDEIADIGTRGKVAEKLKLLDRYIRELQDSVMAVRMVPMETIYSKFPKTIRDISKKLDKKVDFKHIGDNVEIDKAMIEGLTDPLMHIVRNSLDHGLENPDARRTKGKPETGTITISAEQANGQILISISDDGAGIPADKVALKAVERGVLTKSQYDQMTHDDKVMMIFSPGLSTAEQVTDISGRGVGMDVVKTNITKLGGNISVATELGIGTTITIALPLTLAILDGLNIRISDKNYILPLASIVESLQPKSDMIKRIGDGEEELLMLRNEFIPVVRMHKLFSIEPEYHELTKGMLIVVRAGTQKLALFVDEFLHQQQVVVKPIDKNFTNVKGIGGATVRGDGSIGLIIDVIGILEEQKKYERRRLR